MATRFSLADHQESERLTAVFILIDLDSFIVLFAYSVKPSAKYLVVARNKHTS